MKKPREQNVTRQDAKSADQSKNKGPFTKSPIFTISDRIANPRSKDKDATRHDTPSDTIDKPWKPWKVR
jgi:hypothetical protein